MKGDSQERFIRGMWVIMLEGEVVEKDQVKSTPNRRAYMRNLMPVEVAKGVCKADYE
jgi:hypothetical protein